MKHTREELDEIYQSVSKELTKLLDDRGWELDIFRVNMNMHPCSHSGVPLQIEIGAKPKTSIQASVTNEIGSWQ